MPSDSTPRILAFLSVMPQGREVPTVAKGYLPPTVTFGAPQTTVTVGGDIRRAADDLQCFSGSVFDGAEAQFVGVRMRFDGQHFADDNTFKGAVQCLDIFDLKPGKRQFVGKSFNRVVKIHKFFQPAQCKFHSQFLVNRESS
jgi:hypothetical protein